ncbi:MAG TPA: hypothetical protein VGO47_09505, partial [Chlamydiales bacterium]|nr:hypothetical protein [Chlamydiales bacterium]
MSAAQTICNFEGQPLGVDPAILAEVKKKRDVLEDQQQELAGADQPSFRSKSSKRFFLAQAPACNRPELSGEALADQTPTSPTQLAKLMENSPSSFAKVPEGIQKLALSLVATGKDQNSGNLFDYLTALVLFQIATGKSQTDLAS